MTVRPVTSADYPYALEALFKSLDVNGNNYISMNELVTGIQSRGFNCHKSVLEKMFRLLDGAEYKEKDLVIGPRTRQTTQADEAAIGVGKLKYTTLTTKMKDGALDKVEFMEYLGHELALDDLPDDVKESAEARRKIAA